MCKEGLGEGAWREGGRDWREGKDSLKVWEGGWKEGGWDWKERKEGYSKTPRLKVLGTKKHPTVDVNAPSEFLF